MTDSKCGHQKQITKAVLNRVTESITRHVKHEVLGVGVYGSTLRGYADVGAGTDFAVIVRRHNKDYFHITPLPMDAEKRRAQEEIEAAESRLIDDEISRDVGFRVSISIIDERKAILGVLTYNPNTVGAVYSVAENSEYVRDHILSLHDKYLSIGYGCSKQLDVANFQISRLRQALQSQVYRQERNYLTALWCTLRAIDLVLDYKENTVSEYNTTLPDLISLAKENYSEHCPVINTTELFAPFYRRMNRGAFDTPVPVSQSEIDAIEKLYSQAVEYIGGIDFEDYKNKASGDDIARELLAMYNRTEIHHSSKK